MLVFPTTHCEIETCTKWGFFGPYDTTNLVFLPFVLRPEGQCCLESQHFLNLSHPFGLASETSPTLVNLARHWMVDLGMPEDCFKAAGGMWSG